MEGLLQLEISLALIFHQLVPLTVSADLLLLDLLIALFFQSHDDHILLVLERVVHLLVLVVQLAVDSVRDFPGVHLHHRRNLALGQVVGHSHCLLVEVHDHLGKLLLRGQVRVLGHLLGHFGDDHVPHVVVLKCIVFVAGFAVLAVTDGTVDHAILVSLVVELERFFSETFFSQDQAVLVSVRVKMDDSQAAIDLDHLSPV